jgi:hypothetical protein
MRLLELQKDPSAFRAALLIDADAGPVRLSDCIDPWQATDFAAIDSGWRRAAGQRVEGEPVYQRAWLERPRGHSKSSDVMIMAAWALFAARKPINGVVVAVDRDQAALDRDHLNRLVAANPWLDQVLEVQAWRVVNRHTGSALDIMASDVASSYGLLLDFAVCDEVTLWPKRELFDSILSAAAKRSTCLLLCIGNAGFQESWQWSLREAIRAENRWFFSRLEGPVASWITQADLAEQRRLLPGVAFDRLWLNLWTAGAGDALEASDLDAAFDADLRPLTGREPGYEYILAFDLGIKRNWSAAVVLGVKRGRRDHGALRLAAVRTWKPTKARRVDLSEVEATVADLIEQFGVRHVIYDEWQAAHLASRLQSRKAGRLMRRNPLLDPLPSLRTAAKTAFTAVAWTDLPRIASAMLQAFVDRRLRLFPHEALRRDLRCMRVEERKNGTFRLTFPEQADGSHGDVATALSYAVHRASQLAEKPAMNPHIGIYFDGSSSTPATGDDDDAQPRWAAEAAKRRNRAEEHESLLRTLETEPHAPETIIIKELFGPSTFRRIEE